MDLVKYYELRNKIKTGDCIFFSGTHLMARLIRWRSKSKYSHVGMLVRLKLWETERVFLIHAVYPAGVVFVLASRIIGAATGSAELVMLKHQWAAEKNPDYQGKMADFLGLQSGRKYDVSGVLKFILPFFKNSASAYFCSELAGEALKHVGFLRASAQITPGKLRKEWVFGTGYLLG